MSNKKKKRILKPWARMILICILAFLLLISILLIYNGKNPSDDSMPSYNYKTNSDIKYKVYLNQNDFYEEEYLTEDKQYPAELINYIDIDFSYLFTGSKKSNYNYTYDVVATIIGEYENTSSGRSELWKKKYTLLEAQNKNIGNTTTFDINQNIKIKYNDYNKVVNEFKSKFRLAIDAYLNVKVKINYDNEIIDLNSNVSNIDTLEVNIPLTSSTITINRLCNGDAICPKELNKKLNKTALNYVNTKFVTTGYIILIVTIMLTILSIPSLLTTSNSYYSKRLNKLMKGFSEIIIEVESLPDFSGLEILDVKTFDDMVDIEEEIK